MLQHATESHQAKCKRGGNGILRILVAGLMTVVASGFTCRAAIAHPATSDLPVIAPADGNGIKTSVGGQVFADYVFPQGTFAQQTFEIRRARIYANGAFSPNWSGAVVTNVRNLTGDVGGKSALQEVANVTLEMAYLQAANLWPGSQIQMGCIVTPWFEYESQAWGYRMLGLLPDAGGISPDQRGPQLVPFYDYGVSVQGQYALAGIPMSYSLAMFNGEDSRNLEGDGQKDYQVRLTVTPLPGLDLTFTGHKHNPSGQLSPEWLNREMLLATYEHDGWRLAFEGNWAQNQGTAGALVNGQILGGWLIIPVAGMPIPTELVFRGDQVMGDRASLSPTKGMRYETIAGISIAPTRGVRLVLDNQNVDFRAPDGGWLSNENTVGIHTELRF